jgi:hypothetical protein
VLVTTTLSSLSVPLRAHNPAACSSSSGLSVLSRRHSPCTSSIPTLPPQNHTSEYDSEYDEESSEYDSEYTTEGSHSDQDNYDSEDDLERAFQVEERKRRNRWTKRKLHKSNHSRRMCIPTGSKSTANGEPAPDEEMQWKYEVEEFGEANDIDNELKIRRWVIHQMVIDEKFVIRAADNFTWADEVVHDQVKEITNEEGKTIEGILIYK